MVSEIPHKAFLLKQQQNTTILLFIDFSKGRQLRQFKNFILKTA